MRARGKRMLEKNRRHLLFFGFFVCLLAIVFTLQAAKRNNVLLVEDIKSFLDNKEIHTKGLPIRLQIKKLSIDAPIFSVGITKDGAMDTPKGPQDIGWYSPGARPGEKGSAVLTGHYGWKDGKAAVFDNLSLLKVGDIVTVVDDVGKSASFIVTGLKTYDVGDDARDVFISNDGTHLNLITCMGRWNISKKSYNKRLVVFTDLVR